MPDDWKPVSYDANTRQLNTVPDAFDQRPLGVLSIVYSAEIDAGKQVQSGDEVAVVQWEDNSREPLTAPDGCAGTITDVNRNLTFENLPFAPSQWLLILAE